MGEGGNLEDLMFLDGIKRYQETDYDVLVRANKVDQDLVNDYGIVAVDTARKGVEVRDYSPFSSGGIGDLEFSEQHTVPESLGQRQDGWDINWSKVYRTWPDREVELEGDLYYAAVKDEENLDDFAERFMSETNDWRDLLRVNPEFI